MGTMIGELAALALTEGADGVTIPLRVVPRARRNGIDGVVEGALRVRIAAPPVEGAANKALLGFLAAALGLPKRDLAIIAGERGRQKLLRVQGQTVAQLRQRFLGHEARR